MITDKHSFYISVWYMKRLAFFLCFIRFSQVITRFQVISMHLFDSYPINLTLRVDTVFDNLFYEKGQILIS